MQTTRILTLAALAAAVFVAPASGVRLDDRWHLTITGTKLSGTYTNTTASVVNGFAVGTALKSKNPIVSFTIAGRTCSLYAPYGSAYCHTNIAVKPGATVTFSGATKEPVGSGVVQMCDTADRGVDNTCLDVKGGKGSTPSPTTTKETATTARVFDIDVAIQDLATAITHEENAVQALSTKHVATAKKELGQGSVEVGLDITQLKPHRDKTLDPILNDLQDVKNLDGQAEDLLRGKHPDRLRRARVLIENAIELKRSAREDLQRLTP